jgi:tripartite-type tricarboxylate transporter receptor subunit TctC
MTEAGMPGFNAATWFGLFGPASMSQDLRQKIYQAVHRIVAEPGMQQRLLDMGGEINNSSPEAFQKVIDAEVKNWAQAVKLSGASID